MVYLYECVIIKIYNDVGVKRSIHKYPFNPGIICANNSEYRRPK